MVMVPASNAYVLLKTSAVNSTPNTNVVRDTYFPRGSSLLTYWKEYRRA